MNNRLLWAGLALCIAGFFFYARRETPVATVAIAPDGGPVACRVARGDGNPAQTDVLPGVGEFRLGQATVSPLAGFHIEARVLGREDYRNDHEATWSPIDLALGWGRMADPAVYRRLDIRQGGRWYRYRWGSEGPPIPADEIVRSSANMHMVPASDTVARQLAAVRAGDDIRLSGLLVHIRGDDGFQWRSSLTREDSGGGACELIYVCSLEIRSR